MSIDDRNKAQKIAAELASALDDEALNGITGGINLDAEIVHLVNVVYEENKQPLSPEELTKKVDKIRAILLDSPDSKKTP